MEDLSVPLDLLSHVLAAPITPEHRCRTDPPDDLDGKMT